MKHESGVGWLALSGAILEGEQNFVYGPGRALCRAVARYRPWLEVVALRLAQGNKARAKTIVRAAVYRLWEWDVGRFSEEDAEYLKRALLAAIRLTCRSPVLGVRRDAAAHPSPEHHSAETGQGTARLSPSRIPRQAHNPATAPA
jgi:hypothetical protein